MQADMKVPKKDKQHNARSSNARHQTTKTTTTLINVEAIHGDENACATLDSMSQQQSDNQSQRRRRRRRRGRQLSHDATFCDLLLPSMNNEQENEGKEEKKDDEARRMHCNQNKFQHTKTQIEHTTTNANRSKSTTHAKRSKSDTNLKLLQKPSTTTTHCNNASHHTQRKHFGGAFNWLVAVSLVATCLVSVLVFESNADAVLPSAISSNRKPNNNSIQFVDYFPKTQQFHEQQRQQQLAQQFDAIQLQHLLSFGLASLASANADIVAADASATNGDVKLNVDRADNPQAARSLIVANLGSVEFLAPSLVASMVPESIIAAESNKRHEAASSEAGSQTMISSIPSIAISDATTNVDGLHEEVLRDGNNQVISRDKLFDVDDEINYVSSTRSSPSPQDSSTSKFTPIYNLASMLSQFVGFTSSAENNDAKQQPASSNRLKLSQTLDENKRRDLLVQTKAIESRGLLSLDSSNHLMLPQMQQIKSRFNQGCVGGTKCQFFAFCWMSGGSLGASCGLLMTCCVTPSKTEIQPVFYGPVVNDPYCGRSTSKISRIVGGTDASFGQFPWQAFVQVGGSRCGGALISSRHVVTAGHCVARSQHSPSSIKVTLGDYILNSDIESLPHEVFSVVEVLLHPNFRFTPQADRYDVAVLELDRVASYKDNIKPICLPQKDATFVGRVAYVAGWGALQAGSKLRPKVLQHVAVPVIENNVCESWHRRKGIDIRIYDEMMCAGYEMGNRDACQGDSGGPLMLNQFGVWYLVGIVSAGYSCAKQYQPGIYHRVSSSSDWISSNLDRI